MTKTINVTDARQQFSQLLNQVFRRETRVLVEKSGIPVAAIISASDLERLNQLEAQRQRDFAIIDDMRAAFADVPEEELQREVAKAVAQVRAEAVAQKRRARSPK